MNNTAFIIVDVQNDFLKGGALEVKDGNDIIPIINKLQDKFSFVVATQDWHPSNHKSFASQYNNNKVGDFINLNGIQQILWPDHCVEDTFGSELSNDLNKSNINRIIQKGSDPEVDSYSGFFDNDKKSQTGLDEYLLGKDIDTVYICGLATDYCVKYTALDAVKLGYETYLITDACKGVNINTDDSENAISEMEEAGVILVNSKDF